MQTRKIVYLAVMVALNCVGGFISIPVGTMPVTMQTFFAVMSGFVLGPVLGALAQLIYIAMGLIGLPVFSNGGGGILYVLRPSFGFLVGFVFAAIVAGLIANRMPRSAPAALLGAAALGLIPLYLIGVTYQLLILRFVTGLGAPAVLAALGATPLYIAGDLATLAVLSLIASRLRALGYRRIDAKKDIPLNDTITSKQTGRTA